MFYENEIFILHIITTHDATIDLYWSSPSSKFDLTIMEINLTSSSSSHYLWYLQTKNIENLLPIIQHNEIQRFHEGIVLISKDDLYSYSSALSNTKVGINGFGRIGRLMR
ncbi:unnamed protein product [Rotaria sordida]|uniref:Uncharacterized protein n=1 Tax=Rotaria sordida TaxID=392033 RepID=A0A818X946_9BILA|nr:unnamed protein product [Rotaria sordida]CAF1325553.1 unnamed protein product [Rotaria sordida]CAF3737177.1 unnamed protein product [Rotaria sordida]CAF3852872.1 unnamed protein product [Rotaria sordida]